MKNTTHSIFQKFTIILCLLTSGVSYAQISNCNVYLIGNKLEMGINWNGAFGASSAPPAGAHSNSNAALYNTPRCTGALYSGPSIGMVADPDEDGWSAGAIPYYGDFVLPGGAKEGWSIMFNGVQKNAWNSDAAIQDSIDNMSCYIYSYRDTLGIKQGATQAVFDGIYITQWVNLDTSKLFATVQVLIENTSIATAGSVFYMRTINPHNDQMVSGNPNTWNKIEYQYVSDTGHRAMVSARGTIHNNAYMALGTKDDRALAFIAKTAPAINITTDYISFGDTNFLYNFNDSINANTNVGILYDIGNLTSGSFALLNYFYAFRPDVVNDAIYSTELAVDNAVLATRHYHVYPNPITSSFKIMGIEKGDEVQLYDMVGRRMACDAIGDNEYLTHDLPTGTYLVVVKARTGMIKGRVTIQKN